MSDRAMEWAEKYLAANQITTELYGNTASEFRRALEAAFRAGEVYGHAAANRIEVRDEGQLNASRGL